MSDNINLQEIRERILSENYGKFDLIEDIISPQEILNLKPRIVLKKITERLSIPLDNINRNTFWSWLRRYKKNNSQINVVEDKVKHSLVQQPGKSPEKKVTNMDWLHDFIPLEPENGRVKPTVINVIQSRRDSNQT